MEDIQITQENFINQDATVLLNANKYPEIETVVFGLDYAGSTEQDIFAQSMLEKLNQVADRIPSELFSKYLRLMRLLKLFSLKYLSDAEIEKFISEELLDVYVFRHSINIRDEIEKIFKANFDAPDIKEHYRNLLSRSLERNNQILGTTKIRIYVSGQEQEVVPTLKNWLADYTSDTHVDPTTKIRGAYGQMNYLNHSPNVALLQKEERELLLEIIQLYDWIQFDKFEYNFRLPNQPRVTETIENFDKPVSVIPSDMVELVNKIRQNRLASQAVQVVSAPQTSLQEKNKIVQTEVQTLHPMLRQDFTDQQKSVETSSLMDIKTDIENKRRKAQEEIDRKLEELKRKIQK